MWILCLWNFSNETFFFSVEIDENECTQYKKAADTWLKEVQRLLYQFNGKNKFVSSLTISSECGTGSEVTYEKSTNDSTAASS